MLWRTVSTSPTNKCKSNSSGRDSSSAPEAPSGLCCMSGCANCVWLDYAEEMIKTYAEKGKEVDIEDIIKEVEANIDDPMMRAFIKLELKSTFVFNNKKNL